VIIRMRILKLISIADIFTTINALLGLGSIMASMRGLPFFAINLILLGVIIDGVDGVFARRFSKRWYLGDYLDLMSDTVTFCVAPSILMFSLYFDPAHMADLNVWASHLLDLNQAPALIMVGCSAIVVTGVLRLARFCYQTPFMGEHFIGIPTPSSALTLSLMIMLTERLKEAGSYEIPPAAIGAMALVLAYLMICDIPYLKMKGKTEWLAGGLVLLAIVLNEMVEIVAMVFIASLIYILGGPLVLKRKKKGPKKKKKGPKRKKGRKKKDKKRKPNRRSKGRE